MFIKRSFICYKIKIIILTDTGWYKLFDGHTRQMFGFPVGRLCEKFGDETKFETRTSRCHRLFTHIWCGFYRSKGPDKQWRNLKQYTNRYSFLYILFKVIEMLTQDFSKRGQALFFYNLKPSVVAVFEGVQPKGFITYYHRHDLDRLFQRWKSVFTMNSFVEIPLIWLKTIDF